ncbi:MAG: DUF3240 family protein [Pseudomonadota bacterium]|nr:DUF3240 family protein [Pseudomonadota bacterium]
MDNHPLERLRALIDRLAGSDDPATPLSECLLTVVIPPQIEEATVDWLLARHEITGFSSVLGYGHGTAPESYSVAEQVVGRQPRLIIQTHLAEDVAHLLIEALRADFAGSDLHYWLTPILTAGHLG